MLRSPAKGFVRRLGSLKVNMFSDSQTMFEVGSPWKSLQTINHLDGNCEDVTFMDAKLVGQTSGNYFQTGAFHIRGTWHWSLF